MAPTRAEVTLVSLKNCFVNLPPNLIALLSNANTPPQNVVVELQYQVRSANGTVTKIAFAGWTGMPSRTRPQSLLNERSRIGREQDVQSVEVDVAFAKTLGLLDGHKVGLQIHLDPPEVQAINIEPLTPQDWEAIELHANFLELNMLAQIRALPNPAYRNSSASQAEYNHPLTLHLSTSLTANVIATSFVPALSEITPFAKISPGAEIIVAPKARQKSSRNAKGDTRSTASRRSGRSGISGRTTTSRRAMAARRFTFLRAVSRKVAERFASQPSDSGQDSGLKVWLSPEVIASDVIRGAPFASVTVLKPAGLRAQLEQPQLERLKEEENGEAGRPAARIVARVLPWNSQFDAQQVILSSELSTMLDVPNVSGLIVRVEPVGNPSSRLSLKNMVFFPFLPANAKRKEGLKFGGDSKMQKQTIIDRLKIIHGGDEGLLTGPLTDGMILPASSDRGSAASFDGGILRFRLTEDGEHEADGNVIWALGAELRQDIDVRGEIPRPLSLTAIFPTFESGLQLAPSHLVGVEKLLKQSMASLTLCSSILLTGGIGSGKTATAQWLGVRLVEDYLFNVTYLSCAKLVTDEIRVSTIKEMLTRLFMSASWCSRLGGQSVVILDDLDKICPAETELQVGNDNGRSQQVTEILCALSRQYCSIQSGVALLATAQSKDNLHNLIIGGHIVGEIISLKAPSKEVRRDLLSYLLATDQHTSHTAGLPQSPLSPRHSESGNVSDDSWMNPSNPSSPPHSLSPTSNPEGFRISSSLDLLDIASRTDGYMPADLNLLVSRARSECLIRLVSTSPVQDNDMASGILTLTKADFDAALQNFTPTSLRNVTLTHSTTTFSAIGGLRSTRDTLLETLLYPTKYAPIFAASLLRLRSGLLLYGYPGCGKTLLASAVAGECGLNFISVKGPEILNKYIGASEKSVRDLFERAQAAKPCVLFFDEFDSIAPKRGHDSTGVTDRVVNQMLTQMDGAEGLDGVYVLAATSRPDLIDPALLRPGRLDKSLLCDMPDAADREDIIRAVSTKLHLQPEVEARVADIAARTEGLSGADLQALMYNAHLEAIHDLLGEQSPGKQGSKKNASEANGAINGSRSHSSSSSSRRGSRSKKSKETKDDFIQFLYDAQADEAARKAVGSAGASLDPRAIVAAKLEEMKIEKRREKELARNQRNPYTRPNGDLEQTNGDDKKKGGSEEVVISWKHIEKSLASTRSSISPQERRRLENIYREFVTGRNGEMPTGDGGREVGGRSSLM